MVLQVEDPRKARPVAEWDRSTSPPRPGCRGGSGTPRSRTDLSAPPAARRPRRAQAVWLGRRFPVAGLGGILIGGAAFTPAAIGVLPRFEPGHRATDVRLPGILADGPEAAKHRPSAVDVVGAPPPVPRAVGALGAADEVEAAPRGRIASRGSPSMPISSSPRPVRSSVEGSSRAPWSAKGMLLKIEPVVVGVEGSPSRRRRPCMPRNQAMPARPEHPLATRSALEPFGAPRSPSSPWPSRRGRDKSRCGTGRASRRAGHRDA